MILAELEYFHSRPIAPTRRVALGDSSLPCDPAPGFGGILLGAVVAANTKFLDDDVREDLIALTKELEHGLRIPQPRLRYRFQKDRVGLLRSHARLVRANNRMDVDFDDKRSVPAQRTLAAVYAAGALPNPERRVVFRTIRAAMEWHGPVGPALLDALSGANPGSQASFALEDPVGWALTTLGFRKGTAMDLRDGLAAPARTDVQQRFRILLREAHPDHGGDTDDAAQKISDLREARRILLA